MHYSFEQMLGADFAICQLFYFLSKSNRSQAEKFDSELAEFHLVH